MNLDRGIALVGSREFRNYAQFKTEVDKFIRKGDIIVSGGANDKTPGMGWDSRAKSSADAFAQRYAKENAYNLLIIYPQWYPNGNYDRGAGYKRNEQIVEKSDLVLVFYAKGRFQIGGSANTAEWARKLGRPLHEFEEE